MRPYTYNGVTTCNSPGPALDAASARARDARPGTEATIWQTAIGQMLMAEIADLAPEVYRALEEDVRLHGVRGSQRYIELRTSLVVWLDRARESTEERAR